MHMMKNGQLLLQEKSVQNQVNCIQQLFGLLAQSSIPLGIQLVFSNSHYVCTRPLESCFTNTTTSSVAIIVEFYLRAARFPLLINDGFKNVLLRWMFGEMAGDEIAIPILLGLGLDEFSLSAVF